MACSSDHGGGGSLVLSGSMIKQINVQAGISALVYVLIQNNLGKGEGNDEALNRGHAKENQTLHSPQ